MLKDGFGLHYDEQKKAITDFSETVQNLRVGNRKKIMPWQRGIVTSSNAILNVFHDMKQMYDIDYLITARFNQVSKLKFISASF